MGLKEQFALKGASSEKAEAIRRVSELNGKTVEMNGVPVSYGVGIK